MIIKGYRGTISIEEAEALASQGIYVFNAKCVGGRDHILYAYKKAKEMIDRGKNIANKLHIEIMLILTGTRQISLALKMAGINNANEIVAISEKEFELPLNRDDSVIDCDISKLQYLGIKHRIKDKECDAVFENSAMLYLER